MKGFITTGLSVLLLSVATATAAQAETRVEHQLSLTESVAMVSPSPAPVNTVPAAPTTRVEQQLSLNPTVTTPAPNAQLSAFDVVSLAYQGYFRAQGVPAYGALVSSVYHGRTTAKVLVQAAINSNNLSAETLNNEGYLNAVQANLLGLDSH